VVLRGNDINGDVLAGARYRLRAIISVVNNQIRRQERMAEYDIGVFHYETKDGEWLRPSYKRFKITGFSASGTLYTLFEGEWWKDKYQMSPGYTDADYRRFGDNRRAFSSLLADGWIRLGKEEGADAPGQTFYRESPLPSSDDLSISERIVIVNEFIQSGQHEEFAPYLMEALTTLRDRRTSRNSVEFVELLERLSRLHQAGQLSDSEFAKAKLRALESED